MNHSERLFWKWIETECESSDYATIEGICYEHSNSDYISPIIKVDAIVNEKGISCSARVPCTEEDWYEKYPLTSNWVVKWEDLEEKGLTYFLKLLDENLSLELLKEPGF